MLLLLYSAHIDVFATLLKTLLAESKVYLDS